MARRGEIHRPGKGSVMTERSRTIHITDHTNAFDAICLTTVADALGLHDVGLGGVMMAERSSALDWRRSYIRFRRNEIDRSR